jgi:UDP-N-acetylglucosamine 2-epimerase (non-hydrolysing)
MKKLLFVFGTRPEAIKMAPVIKEFKNKNVDFKVCVTAQHREMLDSVLAFFNIVPDYDLNLMRKNQDLSDITSAVILGLRPILKEFDPDYVFVHGDTTTSFAASLAAFYAGNKVCHIEAGLRTFNMRSPYPEEMNRTLTARLVDLHFAPTQKAKQNLIAESVLEENILVTGNTVIDALYESVALVESNSNEHINKLQSIVENDKKIVLVTGHRRENFGQGFLDICTALKKLADKNPAIQIIYPVHLNPNVQKPVFDLLSNTNNICLISPLDYEAFVWLMNKSFLIITDSGGVQEEAPSLGKPVIVMRDTTERPEAVDAGTVLLVGTDSDKIFEAANKLISDENFYLKMSEAHNPYGDGKASERIVDFILNNVRNEY